MSVINYNEEDKTRFINQFEKGINDLKNINGFYDRIKAEHGNILKVTNDYTKSSLERINRGIQQLKGKFDELKKTVDDLKAQISAKDTLIQENAQKMKELEDARNAVLVEIQELKSQSGKIQEQIAPLQQQLAQLQSENANLKTQVGQFTQERAGFQEQLKNIQADTAKQLSDLKAANEKCNQDLKQKEDAFSKFTSDIATLQASNGKLIDENNGLIQRIVDASLEIKKASDYLNELMDAVQVNPQNRELLNEIEKSIQGISNYINGSGARVVGGKKSRKSRKSKKSRKSRKSRNKKQKGGFLYKPNTKRKILRSITK